MFTTSEDVHKCLKSVYKLILKCSQLQKMFTNVKHVYKLIVVFTNMSVFTISENIHKYEMFTNFYHAMLTSENVHKYGMFTNFYHAVFTMSENVHKYEMFTNFSQCSQCQKTFTDMKCSTFPNQCSQCQKMFTNMKCSLTSPSVHNVRKRSQI